MAIDFVEWLTGWEDVGLFNVVLPFLLVFTVCFAVLQKVKLFGDKSKNFNAVISFVLALLFVRNQTLVEIVNGFLPNVSMFLIVILMFLLVVGIFAGPKSAWKGIPMSAAFIISLLFVIWAFFSDAIARTAFGLRLPDWLVYMDDQTKTTIIFIAIFVIVIWFVTRESGPKGERVKKAGRAMKKGIDESFGE